MEGRSSSKPEIPILTKAQQIVNKADEAKSSRKYEQAVDLYRQAAELYLRATNYTSDLESMKHLQQLSDSCSGKATELEKHIRVLSEQQQKYLSSGKIKSPVGSPEGRPIVGGGIDIPSTQQNQISSAFSVSPHSISPSFPSNNLNNNSSNSSTSFPQDGNQFNNSPKGEPLYGSQNYFIGQDSASLSERKMDEIVLAYPPKIKRASDSIATIQVQNENLKDKSLNSPSIRQYGFDVPLENRQQDSIVPNYLSEMMNGVDMWGWMEKMIDILPKPIVNMALPHKKQESKLISFFNQRLLTCYQCF
eukprot:TRINITY_DN3142_c0_g1_i2.p1 TRINITY_DN3142_c0_g1~~TRINITY_DN3142_c0_g1_i2.p1  ORF type:complete len:305 (-),score=98.71 TRINITY_DN3142_c0_g1_i2:510-1424(-)